jgi:TPP-dependent pyruvate/acetoin dehydrogenase alpha subunit
VEAKDQELALLKDMVRARKADARTRELKRGGGNARRAAGDEASAVAASMAASPVSNASAGVAPTRKEPPVNVMKQL